MPGRFLLMITLLAGVAGSPVAFADDARDRLKQEIAELEVRLAVAERGPAAKLAPAELERARTWIEQADEARTRRILGLARMLRDNAAIDLRIAEARVRADELTQRRKQLIGRVEALERASDGGSR